MTWTTEQVERFEQLTRMDNLTEEEFEEMEQLSDAYYEYTKYVWGTNK